MNHSIIIKSKNKIVVLSIPDSDDRKLFDIVNLIKQFKECLNSCKFDFLADKINEKLNTSVQFLPLLAEIVF